VSHRRAIYSLELCALVPEAAKQPATVPVKGYDWFRWLMDRVDSFPKNQRFIFGTRLADRAIGVLELLVEAAYTSGEQLELEGRPNGVRC
jgi:hypothetical protein